MKTLILIAAIPTTRDLDTDMLVLRGFVDTATKILEPCKGTLRIVANAWQLPLDDGLRILPKILVAARQAGIHILAHVADDAPTWAEMKS
jgi:hypothetical protein